MGRPCGAKQFNNLAMVFSSTKKHVKRMRERERKIETHVGFCPWHEKKEKPSLTHATHWFTSQCVFYYWISFVLFGNNFRALTLCVKWIFYVLLTNKKIIFTLIKYPVALIGIFECRKDLKSSSNYPLYALCNESGGKDGVKLMHVHAQWANYTI